MKTVVLRPGETRQIEGHIAGPARFLGVVSPGGFEGYFRELAAAGGDGTIDPSVVGPLLAKYDYEPA